MRESRYIGAMMIALLVVPTAIARGEELTVIAWNVESGGADPEVIAQRIAAFDGCDVTQIDGTTGNIGYDRIAKLILVLKLVDRPDKESLIPFFESAAREIDVLGTNARGDLLYADTKLRQLLLVRLDLDFIFEPAADLDGGRTFFGLQVILDAVLGMSTQCL